QKFQRRLRIASIMCDFCKSSGDGDGIFFWSYILCSLGFLTQTGMSDKETIRDQEGSGSIRVILARSSRHPTFRILFRYVDNIPSLYPDLFQKCGRKPMKRVPA
ncbi:uncharacterized protein C8R40DRAFT_991294, partial [Lentinula edodes]|uniref:uncharacterized protein n=1 Tax=Lentinula edodes TaxID=5353 RepID=UPI001E8E6507